MRGHTYFSRNAFSINEGEFPNIHVRWRRPIGFYVAISQRFRFSWFR